MEKQIEADTNLGLKKACLSNDYATIFTFFKELSDKYFEQKEFHYVAGLCQYILRLVEKHELKVDVTQIHDRIKTLEQALLSSLGYNNKEHVDSSNSRDYRAQLDQIRSETFSALTAISESKVLRILYDDEDVTQDSEARHQRQYQRAQKIKSIFQKIQSQIYKLLNRIINDGIALLGSPPCGYSVVALGSLARTESTPYSDVEFAFLISDNNDNKTYFRHLTQFVYLVVINLGETILPAIGIPELNHYDSDNPGLDNWFFDGLTDRGFSFDGAMRHASKTPLGFRNRLGVHENELILTPNELFEKFKTTTDNHLVSMLQSVSYVSGSKDLFLHYLTLIHSVNNTEKNLQILATDANQFAPNIYNPENSGKLYQPKSQLYRMESLVVQGLAVVTEVDKNLKDLFCEPDFSSPWSRLDRMRTKGIISVRGKENLEILISLSNELRLKTYSLNRKQSEKMAAQPILHLKDEDSKTSERIYEFSDAQQLLARYYMGSIPLWKAVKALCNTASNKSPNTLSTESFFDNSDFVNGLIYFRYSSYEKSLSYFQHVQPNDFYYMAAQYNIMLAETNLDKHTNAQEVIARFKLNTSFSVTKNNVMNVVSIMLQKGIALENIGKILEAIKIYKLALRLCQDFRSVETESFEALAYNNMGSAYLKIGAYDKAHFQLMVAVSLCEARVPINENHDLAGIYANYGLVLVKIGKTRLAFKYIDKALSIRKKLYGNQMSTMLSDNYKILSEAYYEDQQYDHFMSTSLIASMILFELGIDKNSEYFRTTSLMLYADLTLKTMNDKNRYEDEFLELYKYGHLKLALEFSGRLCQGSKVSSYYSFHGRLMWVLVLRNSKEEELQTYAAKIDKFYKLAIQYSDEADICKYLLHYALFLMHLEKYSHAVSVLDDLIKKDMCDSIDYCTVERKFFDRCLLNFFDYVSILRIGTDELSHYLNVFCYLKMGKPDKANFALDKFLENIQFFENESLREGKDNVENVHAILAKLLFNHKLLYGYACQLLGHYQRALDMYQKIKLTPSVLDKFLMDQIAQCLVYLYCKNEAGINPLSQKMQTLVGGHFKQFERIGTSNIYDLLGYFTTEESVEWAQFVLYAMNINSDIVQIKENYYLIIGNIGNDFEKQIDKQLGHSIGIHVREEVKPPKAKNDKYRFNFSATKSDSNDEKQGCDDSNAYN